jgi:anti-sigma B factor antagonist
MNIRSGINWTRLVTASVLFCLMFNFNALAQTSTTGNIEGTITDSNGSVIPNATVVLSGDRLLRPQPTISNDDGVFRFGSVPPGKYSVKVEASESYAAFEENEVEVRLSKTTTVDITLRPKGEEATPEVQPEENQKPAQKEEPAPTTKSKYSVAELTIRERQAGDVVILDLEGKIMDGGGATALRDAIRGLLDEGKKKILLNFKGVSHVDDIGIGELVAGYTTTSNSNGQLKLLNLPKNMKDLLMLTKFMTVFQTYDNEEEALNSFY